MTQSIAWGQPCLAPAKINLFLHVIERYAEGYHRLQTVFRLIDLCDRLFFTPRDDHRVCLTSTHEGIKADNDLASRAARLLQQHFGVRMGVDIAIEKRIPLGSGLGGGSSNAATTLMALNTLWDIRADQKTLMTLAKQLGADVPFFIFGQDAFADGIGEQLSPIVLSDAVYLLLFPPASVSTARIFTDPALQRSALPIAPKDYVDGFGANMLTPVALAHYPVIGEYLTWLSQRTTAAMSGSGSTVFGVFATQAEACLAWAQKPSHYQGRLVSPLKSHPLHPDCFR